MMKKPSNSGKPWSPSDLKLLKEDIKRHTPTRKIATHLKRTLDAVYAKASEMHVSLRGPTMRPAHARGKW